VIYTRNMSGYDTRMAEDIWRKLAESEARIHLMMELGDLKVGFLDVEEFCLDLDGSTGRLQLQT
jgi:hypothetical protein